MDADAIVIGAGAAGLAAARTLGEAGAKTLVLEARDRTGGRAWSQRVTRSLAPAELGAEFIHGAAETTMRLLREAGSAALDMSGDSFACDERGMVRQDDDDFFESAQIFGRLREQDEDESAERFLQRFDADPALRATAAMARAFVEGFEAADPALASVRAIAAEIASGVDSRTGRPLGGYRPLVERLENACATAGVQTLLGAAARAVRLRNSSVEVVAQTVEGSRTFSARAAIVTLPAGVLRHRGDASAVVFEPDLPAEKRAALEKIEMGHVFRVTMWFRSRFWERVRGGRFRDLGFVRHPSGPFTAYWTQVPVRAEQVVAWAGGPKAIAMQGLPENEVIAHAIDGFGKIVGDAALVNDELEGAIVHDWSEDPFSRGAYSYVAVGGADARARLAMPIQDLIFFAGEATATDGQSGTVNGALDTGERAAREVLATLQAVRT